MCFQGWVVSELRVAKFCLPSSWEGVLFLHKHGPLRKCLGVGPLRPSACGVSFHPNDGTISSGVSLIDVPPSWTDLILADLVSVDFCQHCRVSCRELFPFARAQRGLWGEHLLACRPVVWVPPPSLHLPGLFPNLFVSCLSCEDIYVYLQKNQPIPGRLKY